MVFPSIYSYQIDHILNILCTLFKLRMHDFPNVDHSLNFAIPRSLLKITPLLPNKLIFQFVSFTVSIYQNFDFTCFCQIQIPLPMTGLFRILFFLLLLRMAHFQTLLTSYDDIDGALIKSISFREHKKILLAEKFIYI